MQRIVAGVGIVILAAVGCSMYGSYLDALPKAQRPPGARRTDVGLAGAAGGQSRIRPAGDSLRPVSSSQAVVSYQVVDGGSRDPQYLFSLPRFAVKNADKANRLPRARSAAGALRARHCRPRGAGSWRSRVHPAAGRRRRGRRRPCASPSTTGSRIRRTGRTRCILRTVRPSRRLPRRAPFSFPSTSPPTLGNRKVVTFDGAKKLPAVKVIDSQQPFGCVSQRRSVARDDQPGCVIESTSSALSSCSSVTSPRSTKPRSMTASRTVMPLATACLAIFAAAS